MGKAMKVVGAKHNLQVTSNGLHKTTVTSYEIDVGLQKKQKQTKYC